jgi:hypothetical protein
MFLKRAERRIIAGKEGRKLEGPPQILSTEFRNFLAK